MAPAAADLEAQGQALASTYKMTEEQAKARGAVAIVPGTTEEVHEVKHQSAGRDGAKPLP